MYASPASTTPQLPWLQAEADGTLSGVKRMSWRSPAQLQALMLGGKGDFWLGSVEGMARARKAGAPVRIVAVTGWRKWVLIGKEEGTWRQALANVRLASCPPGNPGVLLLQNLMENNGGKLGGVRFFETRQLMMKLLAGQELPALIAEPMAGRILEKNPSLRRLASLEEIKAELLGGEKRVPWAAFAINERTAEQNPGLAQDVVKKLVDASQKLNAMAHEDVVKLWTGELAENIEPEMLLKSLNEDLILTVPASEAVEEVREFLKIVAPDVEFDPALLGL